MKNVTFWARIDGYEEEFKFHIIKSNLSPVERYWLKSKIKKFIKYEDI